MAEIVVALDHASGREALALVDRLPRARWVKVGSVLFTKEGPALLGELHERGRSVFLDLKWHDIPNTVARAVTAAQAHAVSMVTVHTLGGPEMLRAAVAAAGDLRIVGVTVLTSHDGASFGRAIGRPDVRVGDEVSRLSALASEAGLAGVVCSPEETRDMRRQLGAGALLVVPGIRRAADAAGDQRRTATAAEAARAGATHLVVGRPVTTAADPVAVLDELLAEAGG